MTFGHPDGAGGLLPIGKLSLNLLYVTVMPSLLSACILVAPLIPTPLLLLFAANNVLLFWLSPLILFAGILGSILALLPVLSFHQTMEKQKIEMIVILEKVSSKIIALKNNFIISQQSDPPENLDRLIKEITALEAFYKSHENINTWPINKHVLVNIWGTQVFLVGQVAAFLNWVTKTS